MRKKGPLQRTVPNVAFVMSVLATVAVGGAQPNGVVLGVGGEGACCHAIVGGVTVAGHSTGGGTRQLVIVHQITKVGVFLIGVVDLVEGGL